MFIIKLALCLTKFLQNNLEKILFIQSLIIQHLNKPGHSHDKKDFIKNHLIVHILLMKHSYQLFLK